MKADILKTENLIKIIPGTILFYGLIYSYSYFNEFDINVISIYSAEELLLGFIPIIRPLFFLTITSLSIPIVIYLSTDYFNSSIHIEKIKHAWIILVSNKNQTFKSLIKLVMVIISNPVCVFFIVGKMLKEILDFAQPEPIQLVLNKYFLYIISLIFFYQALLYISKTVSKFNSISISTITIIMAFFVGAKFCDNLGRVIAHEHSPTSSIYFEYEGRVYCTDHELIPIGDTKEYIILRDLNDNSNLFFERRKINNLMFSSNKAY